MIAAHVVNAQNKHLYEHEFDEFLRRRHDFFVHQKCWRPPSPDGRERDQFDTDAATYLLGLEDGRVVTSARLIPTSEPHMVSEVFPHMCEKFGVPRRPDWAEWTRTFVVPDKRSTGLRGTLTQLCCAVMEYALDEGLSAVGGVQETYFMPHHGALKWRADPMGMAKEENGEWYIVAYIDVNEAALASVRKILGCDHSLIVRRGIQMPFISDTAFSKPKHRQMCE
ncbi:N-acyl-L-homoserine lactone synthetase [Mesorhizobium australicum WSM2073]|uniref:Acyl-homoserine-lactone synthase n=3 Tax=Mesorhizobium TaxID=68287 RepID=L0KIC9_MESAW|nr:MULTISPECIES: acyl-homoserine-lactone synthase [Mesorhizobium]ADV11698.1 autoinducer synthesis protein [Mesorhizobium ciceri biovar biserrulae WSM1271]AEH87204.1 autoinducer synthesis protein [Mesorhizobium opportunistum WSM2075]AGB45097.1 N-acyl-L-homoserine lactone synthetase [Mesorhizobium australicum WSM2073]OBP88714.1 autoinducer synthase [Mesorhizobium loti]